MEVHHITPLSELLRMKKNDIYEVTNGITVCQKCHICIDKFRSKFNKISI